MVAPSGTVNEAIEFFTPIFFVAVSSVTGIVALLLAVENAKNELIPLTFSVPVYPKKVVDEALEAAKETDMWRPQNAFFFLVEKL